MRLLTNIVVAVIALLPAVLVSQAVENPTRAEFTPSADHATNLVTRYELQILTEAGTTPVVVRDLAKPEPVNGVIQYQLAPVLASVPTGFYVARVAAIGPGGVGLSAASNPFGVTAQSPCTGNPVVIVITRLTRAVSRSDPEGAVMLFRATSTVPLRRIKIDVLETPDLPGWEMTYSAGTPTAEVRGFAVRPATVGTWPVLIEAEDVNGCMGKTDGSHRITVVP